MRAAPICLIISLSFTLALPACASRTTAPPSCDGKHRRPANPYGSVLGGPSPVDLSDEISALSPASYWCGGER